ncbi:hypothetical protein CDV55_105016 [Aspergillus turcosus]|uniref:Xylanolytic transcriptional activator regulatory domain-containing protein n=1 Tax=Aspergillus turcosus TaxID=1245748 RepID=A0A229YST7_9EURO|nr:hypothetical protein CDV55_105016 [Aspergillus turcosus]RLL95941.1 hypothetical protein CFD26_104360 [Aspergillus turcosus]
MAVRCWYPTVAQKPGPKVGAPQRRKRRHVSGGDEARLREELPQPAGHRERYEDNRSLQSGFAGMSAHLPSSAHVSVHEDAQTSITSRGLPWLGSTVQPPDRSEPSQDSLSQIMHPSHHLTTDQETLRDPPRTVAATSAGTGVKIYQACARLGISVELYRLLITKYFENMTAFSLFRRPHFESKLEAISSDKQLEALLAAMFSFSAQFCNAQDLQSISGLQMDVPSSSFFHTLAARLIEQALEDCLENTPPLCLLQALILVNFRYLIEGVLGKAWRTLGTCIRIAYELQLHRIDAGCSDTQGQLNQESWSLDEERRRAWWVLWEFDVFASGIRRLPTAIDWTQNNTWLPVDDQNWYSGTYQRSCLLLVDPTLRWKALQRSGNTSARAWFIVINSILHNAQLHSYHQYFSTNMREQEESSSGKTRERRMIELPQANQAELDILENALHCLYLALPPRLAWHHQFLSFRDKDPSEGRFAKQEDCDIYSIHLITQMTRFMIHHHQVSCFPTAEPEAPDRNQAENGPPNWSRKSHLDSVKRRSEGAWHHVTHAANEVASIIRASAKDHVQYVNPFLASTIYLAGAAQVVYRITGPSAASLRVADSNLDLLRLTFGRFVSFWNVSKTLQDKFNTLEARFESILKTTLKKAEANRAHQSDTATLGDPGGIIAQPPVLEQAQPNTRITSSFPGGTLENPLNFSGQNYADPGLYADDSFGSFVLDLEELFTYGG